MAAVAALAAALAAATADAPRLRSSTPEGAAPLPLRILHVDNHSPRLQTTPRSDGSRIMNSHDGFILYVAPLFFHFGIVQPNCTGSPLCKGDPTHCGWGPNTFAVHSSPDLATWTHHTDDALDGRYCEPGTPGCVGRGSCGAFLPKVLWNRRSNRFVMWWSTVQSACGIATAPHPLGPWTIETFNAAYPSGKPVCKGSINFYVEEVTGEAYLVKNWFNTSAHEIVSVERLLPTYLGSAASATPTRWNHIADNSSGLVGEIGSENAMLVKRKGVYTLIEPSLCCYCPWGAGAAVYTAPHPLGPYTKRAAGWNGGWRPCRGYCPDAANHSAIVPIQPAAAVALPAERVGAEPPGEGEPLWLVIGDRWLSAKNGEKSDDFSVFMALVFDAAGQVLDGAPRWHGGTPADDWDMRMLDSVEHGAALSSSSSKSTSSSPSLPAFEFVSVVHVTPAPSPEKRGFHDVIVRSEPSGRRTAWAAGILGELVAVDLTDVARPVVLYNRQEPTPTARLFQARTLVWLSSATAQRSGAGVFALAHRGMDVVNGSDPRMPHTLSNVTFYPSSATPSDVSINGAAVVASGSGDTVVVGAGSNGSLCVARVALGGPMGATATNLGVYSRPPAMRDNLDVAAYVSPSMGPLLCTVSIWGSTVLTVVARGVDTDGKVPPPARWKTVASLQAPTGWPLKTGCNRVQADARGFAFVACFAPELNAVAVVDLTAPGNPRIVRVLMQLIDAPTGLLLAGRALFVAGGQDVVAINVTNPAKASVVGRCGEPCAKVMQTPGGNAHSLAHFSDGGGAHFLVLTAQIDNNLGVVRVADPAIAALLPVS